MPTDHKAVHGEQPAWDLQKLKQETIAENRDSKREQRLRERRAERPWEPAR